VTPDDRRANIALDGIVPMAVVPFKERRRMQIYDLRLCLAEILVLTGMIMSSGRIELQLKVPLTPDGKLTDVVARRATADEIATVRGLWKKTDLEDVTDTYSSALPSHGCALLKVTK
jgi:hypothetical protein